MNFCEGTWEERYVASALELRRGKRGGDDKWERGGLKGVWTAD